MPTAAEVMEFRNTTNIPLEKARRILLNEQEPVLQQWMEVEESDDYLKAGGEWWDVPIETEEKHD